MNVEFLIKVFVKFLCVCIIWCYFERDVNHSVSFSAFLILYTLATIRDNIMLTSISTIYWSLRRKTSRRIIELTNEHSKREFLVFWNYFCHIIWIMLSYTQITSSTIPIIRRIKQMSSTFYFQALHSISHFQLNPFSNHFPKKIIRKI